MPTERYNTELMPVYGGYDLIISEKETTLTLFIQDPAQADFISAQIIQIAKSQMIDLQTAVSIFNRGTGMFENN